MSGVKESVFSFSWMEWVIILLGCVGAASLYIAFPDRWWKIFVAGFGILFTFEAMMEPLFTYHPLLTKHHCIGKTDVNFLFPLAWSEICGITVLLSQYLPISSKFWSYIIAALIVGNINEFTFFKLKFWVYNFDAAMIGNWKPLQPKMTIFGLPVQVILGYSVVGCMVYGICNILF